MLRGVNEWLWGRFSTYGFCMGNVGITSVFFTGGEINTLVDCVKVWRGGALCTGG